MTTTILHFLTLTCPPSQFLTSLKSTTSIQTHYAGRPNLTILRPATTDTAALSRLPSLILLASHAGPAGRVWPADAQALVETDYAHAVAAPPQVLDTLAGRNAALRRRAASGPEVPLDAWRAWKGRADEDKDKDARMGDGLEGFVDGFARSPDGARPVVMVNLLRFDKDGGMERYLEYGRRFSAEVGSKRGGQVLVPGRIVGRPGGATEGWDHIAIVHYPSILAFADMVVSDEYVEINQKYRAGSLVDTTLICTTELEAADVEKGRI